MSIMSTETIVAPAPLKTGGSITFKTDILPDLEDISPPDGKSHYTRKKDLAEPGSIVVALCGKRWVPQSRFEAATDIPLCAKCAELYALLGSMENN